MVIDGDRVPMEPGDLILTPGWSRHGRVHTVWLDPDSDSGRDVLAAYYATSHQHSEHALAARQGHPSGGHSCNPEADPYTPDRLPCPLITWGVPRTCG